MKFTDYADYRKNDIEANLRIARFRPLDIMVTGVTGAGKSTTLNSLFKKCVAKVGDGVDPETMQIGDYRLSDVARFWDTPGLGDGIHTDKVHEKKLVNLLYKTYTMDNRTYGWIDLVLVIIEGMNRDMGTTYKLLNDIIVPNFQRNRILVAINQCDVAMKGRHWNYKENKPDNVLRNFLNEQAMSIQRRVLEATHIQIKLPIYYSAEYGYNVDKLLDFIVDSMPKERRLLVA